MVDVPSGRLETRATVEGGSVRSVRFLNVPSFVWRRADRGRRTGRSTSRSAAPSTRRSRSASAPAELPRLIALGRELKAAIEAGPRGRPSARARVARHLRRDLLAARVGRPGDAAQRDGVRRRRGRPLSVRVRDVGQARAARRAGRLPRGETLRHLLDRRLRVHGSRRGGGPRSRACRRWSQRSRARAYRTGRASSSSTPTTRSGRAFCCADQGTSMRTSFRTASAVKPTTTITEADEAQRPRGERVVDRREARRRRARG